MNKDEMLKYLGNWCNSHINRSGKIKALCIIIPYKYGLKESWYVFWGQTNRSEITNIENCFSFVGSRNDRNAMMSITRMLLLHDFVNWLYE